MLEYACNNQSSEHLSKVSIGHDVNAAMLKVLHKPNVTVGDRETVLISTVDDYHFEVTVTLRRGDYERPANELPGFYKKEGEER